MKILKFLFVFLLLHNVLQVRSQVYTVDISTGVDSTGTLLGAPNIDPRWMVKTPSGSYAAATISTGIAYDPNGYLHGYQFLSDKGWITPFAWTQNELTGATPPQAESRFPQAGDMKWNPEPGVYIYRLKFRIDWPACKRPNSAKLKLFALTGTDSIEDVRLNGQAPVKVYPYVSTYTPYSGAPVLRNHRVKDLFSLWSTHSSAPPTSMTNLFGFYNLPLNPLHLQNGDNYLYVTVRRHDVTTPEDPAGFTCQGDLIYTYGADPLTVPAVTVTGANHKLCGVLTPTLQVSLANLVSVGAQVQVTSQPATLSGFPKTGTVSSTNPFSTTLDATTPATYTITVTSNSTTSPCISVKTVKTYACNIIKIKFNPPGGGNWNGRLFTNGSSGPEETGEESIPGFETKWMLEELDDATDEPLYRIIDPPNWNTDAGESNFFNGFHADNSYTGDVTELEGDLAEPGVFSADRVYRITRYYKSTAQPDWEEHSIMIGPGYDQFEPPIESMTGLFNQVAKQQAIITVYPNPGKDIFKINIHGPGKGSDMTLYDAQGKKIQQVKYNERVTEYTIDLSGYAKGIYFLCMPETNTIQKIIVE